MPQTDTKSRDSFIPNRAYYTENKLTGEVKMERFVSYREVGSFVVSKGFEGYIYMPFSSAYPSLSKNIEKLSALWLNVAQGSGSIYIDTLSLYNNATCRISETLVWKQDTQGMLYGFEKNNSIAGYRGWILGAQTAALEISREYAHSGSNSLKITTPHTTLDDVKDGWVNISLSLKNEDGSYPDMSGYDGIALWLRFQSDGSKTKPLQNQLDMSLQANIPARARIQTTSPLYVYTDKKDATDPTVFVKSIDGNNVISLDNGFAGMVYIPFSTLMPFGGDEIDASKLTDIYLIFRLKSLIGHSVYVDDIQGYKTKDMMNVNWPGDRSYNPLSDPMLYSVTEYSEKAVFGAEGDKPGAEEKDKLNIWLIAVPSALVLAAGITGGIYFYRRKKKASSRGEK